ncbi:cAMP-regulated phosphoprotein 19-related protein [Rhynchospora pubera]|uniref:cAMP-regulated phosphoprotein 19-related protein n=1 Tax=Rhynchospora pubera TaxID=906938 RepID=A0AAV8DQU9_9POAL|nr:cAMP-regulated phosphoprotein 19-related protein [Rhynchospora pubera]KAJ4821533.1 cAMP-regulated phosphoprotein 19-related protein [Rhynchospora pubera]
MAKINFKYAAVVILITVRQLLQLCANLESLVSSATTRSLFSSSQILKYLVECTMSETKPDAVAADVNPDSTENPEINAEETLKKKYGGIVPKKPPLISKDHERAYFDSADWALGKQGAHPHKPKGPLEALRPKLQPTQNQQARSRRTAYASNENLEDVGSNEASNDDTGSEEKNKDGVTE